MRIRILATVILSVVLSVTATLLIDRPIKREAGNTIRTQKIELVDDKGKVRAAFKLVRGDGGGMEPELSMWDDRGEEAVRLRLDEKGMGRLTVTGKDDSGMRDGVTLGRLELDGTFPNPKDRTGWGVVVQNHQAGPLRDTTSIGIMDSGKRLEFSTLPVPLVDRSKEVNRHTP